MWDIYIVHCMTVSHIVIYFAILHTVQCCMFSKQHFLGSFMPILHLSYSVFSSVCVWVCFLAPCPDHSAEEPVFLRLTSFLSSGIGVSSEGQGSCIQGCLGDSSISIKSFQHDIRSLHKQTFHKTLNRLSFRSYSWVFCFSLGMMCLFYFMPHRFICLALSECLRDISSWAAYCTGCYCWPMGQFR